MNVLVGEVIGPHRGLFVTGVEIDVDVHLAGVMSTSERSRPAPPFSQILTPLTSTVTFCES